MSYFLDTSFLIDYMRADRAALHRFRKFFEHGDRLLVNEIVVCEVATGIAPHERADMEALLRPLEFIQPAPDSAILAGDWRRTAREAGVTLSLPDALIAAAAHAMDARLVTRNLRDFARMPVQIETY